MNENSTDKSSNAETVEKKKWLILRNSNFFLLWLGQICNQAGAKMYQLAVAWWILSQMGENGGKALGFFMVLGALPSILLVKFAGRFIDRSSSKKIIVNSDFICSSLMLGVFFALKYSVIGIKGIFVVGILTALVETFFNPTISKALPEIVDENDMEQAVAFQSSTQYLASFTGAVAGAALIEMLGIQYVTLLNCMTYGTASFLESFIEFRPLIKPSADTSPESAENKTSSSSERERMATGFNFFKFFPLLGKILVGFGMTNFFVTPILVIMPLYTKMALNAPASTLGALEACLWVGLIIGTFTAGFINFIKNILKLGAASIFIFGFCMFLSGIFVNSFFYGTMMLIAGISMGNNNVKFIALFQRVVPADIKGKFFAMMQALISFSFPIAYLVFGFLGDYVGPAKVCQIQGVGTMLLSIYFLVLSKHEHELKA
ncbi:MAG: MFS transporter [Candidatus Riflebacteria bacterium]|nr:MFS transporter [Candidatus Riflebacteria bacterium]